MSKSDAPLHRLQRPLAARQKSSFCHFSSSILIPLTSAHWAPGSWERINLFRDVKCEVRPPSVTTSAASTQKMDLRAQRSQLTHASTPETHTPICPL